MSFKTLLFTVYAIIIIIICGAIAKLSKCKQIFNHCTLRSRSRHSGEMDSKHRGRQHNDIEYHPEAGVDGNIHQSGMGPAEPGSNRKRRRGPNVDKGSKRPSSRRKLEAAVPILLQAVELDNAGSLEAVGAYKAVVKLFDDAIEILNNRPSKTRQLRDEVNLRNLRDTYKDRADLLLLEFQERVLNRKF